MGTAFEPNEVTKHKRDEVMSIVGGIDGRNDRSGPLTLNLLQAMTSEKQCEQLGMQKQNISYDLS